MSRQFIQGRHARVMLSALKAGSSFRGGVRQLEGRSILILAADQLVTALALLELDGIARRLVLCPPGLPRESFPSIMQDADIDAVIAGPDEEAFEEASGLAHVRCETAIASADIDRTARHETEWVLFTSGTTGRPKMAVHTLASLAGAIKTNGAYSTPDVWATFYDTRRYGGLQVYLRAMVGNCSFILSSADEPLNSHLDRLAESGVTHLTGTPSHWRRVLMSAAAQNIAPRYVRLSGEIADQGVLDGLRALYPSAWIVHAYASTEAGVGFEVHDEKEGFPASFIGPGNGVELQVREGSLHIRSARAARHYLSTENKKIVQDDGFVDTGDLVERRGDRYYFAGRKDGVINVGGQKVHPEEVEAIINRHPGVRMSLVRARKNAIIGALVVAEIVPSADAVTSGDGAYRDALESEIRTLCTAHLDRHKVPALIRFVPSLAMTQSGKLARHA